MGEAQSHLVSVKDGEVEVVVVVEVTLTLFGPVNFWHSRLLCCDLACNQSELPIYPSVVEGDADDLSDPDGD